MTASIIDLSARRRRTELAVARVAAAPVRYVPGAFLLALQCRDAADPDTWIRPTPVPPLRAAAEVR